ncbi:cupredoxin domain-containing protein [Cellulophaga baltica]|uniref:cupredoxin domain-containing protein n=1 Tax=Cellulophaga TaxID=104264 RepID=UPI001C071A0C|nr:MULTISPECIES: cupredoxin domain-containing protein [Cellulophaga]MBU2995758.1 cupredoxin domain-containing protein [Cellulophaga baltica]MDO6767152.1 cupredoxin domain-containing protein [Cellulophaga sp. 1_MG-2023]
MKNLVVVLALVVGSLFSVSAQDKMMKAEKVISLEQTKGEFTQKEITVDEGTYTFEVSNNAVGHDVGFVLVKKGDDISKPENHIQTAYVTKAVATGAKQTSKPTKLTKGEYVYFCPLNPTSTDNILTVK